MADFKSIFNGGRIIIFFLLTNSGGCAKLFCPPLKAPLNTKLACKFPLDSQKINCSSSWLPQGTVAQYKCLVGDNNDIKRGRIKCKGNSSFIVDGEFIRFGNSIFPCGIFEDIRATELHVYGYENPKHYFMPQIDKQSDFRQYGTQLHNSFRKRHGVGQLNSDEFLNSKAQSWADYLKSTEGSLSLSSEPNLGQNVFSSDQMDKVSATNDAIQYWYNAGIANYNWTNVKNNWDNSIALDFSQIVWKSSNKIGIGASSKNYGIIGTIIVAFYSPMGNIVLEDSDKPEKLFLQNVLPLVKTN